MKYENRIKLNAVKEHFTTVMKAIYSYSYAAAIRLNYPGAMDYQTYFSDYGNFSANEARDFFDAYTSYTYDKDILISCLSIKANIDTTVYCLKEIRECIIKLDSKRNVYSKILVTPVNDKGMVLINLCLSNNNQPKFCYLGFDLRSTLEDKLYDKLVKNGFLRNDIDKQLTNKLKNSICAFAYLWCDQKPSEIYHDQLVNLSNQSDVDFAKKIDLAFEYVVETKFMQFADDLYEKCDNPNQMDHFLKVDKMAIEKPQSIIRLTLDEVFNTLVQDEKYQDSDTARDKAHNYESIDIDPDITAYLVNKLQK